MSVLFPPRRRSAPASLLAGYSYPKDSAFTAVKGDAEFLNRFVKGVPFVNKKYTKEVPFLSCMVHKRARSWSSGRNLPVQNFAGLSPLPTSPRDIIMLQNKTNLRVAASVNLFARISSPLSLLNHLYHPMELKSHTQNSLPLHTYKSFPSILYFVKTTGIVPNKSSTLPCPYNSSDANMLSYYVFMKPYCKSLSSVLSRL